MSGLLGKLSASSPWLDPVADTLKQLTSPLLGENGPRAVKDLLYGTWMGHPLHPFLTDVTLGALTTSFALDVLGEEDGADMALKLGVLTSGATALSGAAQWYDATNNEEPRRLGALHAARSQQVGGDQSHLTDEVEGGHVRGLGEHGIGEPDSTHHGFPRLPRVRLVLQHDRQVADRLVEGADGGDHLRRSGVVERQRPRGAAGQRTHVLDGDADLGHADHVAL